MSLEDAVKFMIENADISPIKIRKFVRGRGTGEIKSLLVFCQQNAGREPPKRNYGYIHQDLVNILGERLGFEITFGDYREGPDGFWNFKEVRLVVESKTSKHWLTVKQASDYVRENDASSGLIICPEFDEDHLKAAESYGNVRLLTTDGLCKLVELHEAGVLSTQQVVSILVPQETVLLDYFIDIIYKIRTKPEKEAEEVEEHPIVQLEPRRTRRRRPPPSNGRHLSLWPLPGGWKQFVPTLIKMLEVVKSESPTFDEMKKWGLRELGASDAYMTGSIRNVSYMGFLKIKGEVITLTEEGQELLETKNKDIILRSLIKNIWGVKEMLLWLREGALSMDELSKRFGRWQRMNQVTHRVDWLRALGVISKTGNRCALTREGIAILERLGVYRS